MSRTLAILLVNLLLIAAVWYVRSRAQQNPRAFWVFLLYGLRIGPRTDVGYMTKRELFHSGLRFITWGLIFLSLLLGNLILTGTIYGSGEPHGFFITLMFLTALFSAMAFVGGGYLCVRGLLRHKDYVPPSSYYSDEG